MDYKCHIYSIPGVINMRDMGGYAAKDGKITAKSRFIRSTALSGIDEDGESEFKKLSIDCVIDLRSTVERSVAPDVIEGQEYVHFVHVPMLDYISSNFATGDFTNFPKNMTEMYIGLIENSGKDFKKVFDTFADNRFGSYLFHCTAGKDRTGITAMLLLGLAGASDNDIIEDYSLTERLLRAEPVLRDHNGLPKYLFDSKPETMRNALDYIYEKHGSVKRYLEHIGVGEEQQERILKKLFGED